MSAAERDSSVPPVGEELGSASTTAQPGEMPATEPDRESDLLEDLRASIAELDRIAWNLPVRRPEEAT